MYIYICIYICLCCRGRARFGRRGAGRPGHLCRFAVAVVVYYCTVGLFVCSLRRPSHLERGQRSGGKQSTAATNLRFLTTYFSDITKRQIQMIVLLPFQKVVFASSELFVGCWNDCSAATTANDELETLSDNCRCCRSLLLLPLTARSHSATKVSDHRL